MSLQNWTALDCAKQYLGMREVPGSKSHPAILAMLQMDARWPTDDATPWCSGFANWIAWNMGLERSKSLRARSWLLVGQPVQPGPGELPANTVVILSRGRWAPGPEVIKAPGHVGFVAEIDVGRVKILGGNQSDKVSEAWYPLSRVLGFRKLRRA